MGRRSAIKLNDADRREIAAALQRNDNHRTNAAKDCGFSVSIVSAYCVKHRVPKPFYLSGYGATRKSGPASKENLLMASLKKHDNDAFAVVAETGCCITTVRRWAKRNGITLPKRPRGGNKVGSGVVWNPENTAKLRGMFMLDPRPSVLEMAEKMGTSASAIQTAASRFGFSRWEATRMIDALHPQYQKPASGVTRRERDCLICWKPFLSEGFGHRQCPRCFEATCEVAA